MKLWNTLGWLGVLCILAAYALITFGLVTSDALTYILLNLFGALGIIVSSYKKKDFQPVVLNSVWLLIALIGLVNALIN